MTQLKYRREFVIQLIHQKEGCDKIYDRIKLACVLLEKFLYKCGVTGLGTWVDTIDRSRDRLQPTLIKLHHRWNKRGGSSNPYFDLTTALVGSAFMCAAASSSAAAAAKAASASTGHRDRNVAGGADLSWADFEDPGANGSGGASTANRWRSSGGGSENADDTDSDDEMPGPASKMPAPGGQRGGLMGGLGGGDGLMGLVGTAASMFGMS